MGLTLAHDIFTVDFSMYRLGILPLLYTHRSFEKVDYIIRLD